MNTFHITCLAFVVCMSQSAYVTLSIIDPSGKKSTPPAEVKAVLLPATIAADVVTTPLQIAAFGIAGQLEKGKSQDAQRLKEDNE